MKRNLLFSQVTAIGKRLAMVLTMLLIVGIGQVWGADVTFTTSTSGGWTTTAGEQSGEIDGVALAVTNGIINGTQLRCYADATMTISSDNNITNIEITCTGSGTSNYGPGKFSISNSSGNYSYNGTNGTWVGSSKSISLKASAQVRMTKIVVTYTAGGGTGGSGDSGDDSGDDSGECTWQLVTDASTLKVDDQIVIAASNANYALSTTQNSNNRSATAITQNNNNTITIDDNVQIITLCDGLQDNTLGFSVGSAGFLYASSSSGNQLKSKSSRDNNCDWVISITNGGIATIKAQGTNTRNIMRYNPNSGNPIFACYASTSTTGSLPSIYKKVCTTETTVFVIPKCGGDGGGTWLVVIEWFATF